MTTKIDLTKTDKAYYTASKQPELKEIQQVNYLRISGKGDPSEQGYAQRLSALYPVAYAIKFACKEMGKDFTVPKLEGQWWFDEEKFGNPSVQEAPTKVPRSEWEYHALIRMPGFVTKEIVEHSRESTLLKKKEELIRKVDFVKENEGLVIQVMHLGPFSEEPITLEKIFQFSEANGLLRNGLHHEIYLSDFRKTAPEKLKTILREPVKRAN